MSLRFDYVEGANSSPVGYIEGIYVDEVHRYKGISRRLVEAGVEWSKSRGCREIASDTQIDNHASQEFHKRIGFKEAGRLVAFIKEIG
jgi:aminoglycoside 6'-N-acetyltransferase I